jgi:hypothetical protein
VWQLGTSWDCMCSLVSSPSVLPLSRRGRSLVRGVIRPTQQQKGRVIVFVFPQLVPLVGRGAELGAVTPNAYGMDGGWRHEWRRHCCRSRKRSGRLRVGPK